MSSFGGTRLGAKAGTPEPLITALVIPLLAGAYLLVGWGGQAVIRLGVDVGLGVAAAIAGSLCWRASNRAGREFVASWRLIAVGALAWAASEVLYTAVDLNSRAGVSPASAYNAGFLLLPILACAAIVRLPGGGSPWTRSRWVLDGAIVALSVCYIVWTTVVQNVGELRVGGLLPTTVAWFPLVDVALLTALMLAGRRAHLSRATGITLATALILLTGADTSYAYLAITGRYAPGSLCDLLYLAAFASLAAAARMPVHAHWEQEEQRAESPGRLRPALPYLPLAGAAVVGTWQLAEGQPFRGPMLVLFSTICGLVVLRQYLSGLDNRRLVADLQRRQDELHESAVTDPLTGVANRTLFADRVRHALELRQRDGRVVTVCWIDVDDFKVVNDRYGHTAGDRVLTVLAGRMRETLRAGDTLARVGGDEFAVVIENGCDPLAVAARILACADAPIDVDEHQVQARLSVGLSTVTDADTGACPDELMRRADIAMYAAKSGHEPHLAVYQPGMTMPGAEGAALIQPLKAAVAAGEIDVHYQPIVTADTGAVRGFEALARWTLDGETIPPDRFIPVAERMGLARELGAHVLATTLDQLGRWSARRGDTMLRVGVNLSPSQLIDPQLPAIVSRLLRESKVEPSQLYLEITEGALLTDSPHALANAEALAEIGVSLSLDDFGTGYSSLAHLRCFPLTILKIDRSFTVDIDIDHRARQFLQALYRLGRNLDLQIILEGVEKCSQMQLIRSLCPAFVQGHLISPPQPAEAFDALVSVAAPVLPVTAPGTDLDVVRSLRPLAAGSAEYGIAS